MNNHPNWDRVDGRSLKCPICVEHGKKGDGWCLISKDRTAVICPKVSDGHDFQLPNGHWLHRIGGDLDRKIPLPKYRIDPVPPEEHPMQVDLPDMLDESIEYQLNMTPERFAALSEALGVSVDSLERLEVGATSEVGERSPLWTFPMQDAFSQVIGISTRSMAGKKYSIAGSRLGLFVPQGKLEDPIMLCEGASDTATMMDLGFSAIGRHNCRHGSALVRQKLKGRDVVIVADADQVGKAGAHQLADDMWYGSKRVRVISPPAQKDIRGWVRSGATRKTIDTVLVNARTWCPRSKAEEIRDLRR